MLQLPNSRAHCWFHPAGLAESEKSGGRVERRLRNVRRRTSERADTRADTTTMIAERQRM